MANAGQQKRAMGTSPAITPALNPFFGLLPQALWNNAKDFFIYGTDFLPLAAGATQTNEIAIESDSDFLRVAGVRVVTDTANTTFIADVPQLVTLFDSGSGRRMVNRAVHMDNLFGTAQLPSYWPFPKLMPRASTLSVQVQNLDGANARNVRVSFLGFKIFGGF